MKHTLLNFPSYEFTIKGSGDQEKIFDHIRKKYVVLTPEEWVRQHVIAFLLSEKNIPAGLTAVEKQIKYNKMSRRADIVVFNSEARPLLIVECKAPTVEITQEAFAQIARYNVAMRVDYLMVTNGINHYYCKMDYVNWTYDFLKTLPEYKNW
ncbi:MAG: type I restriction enzyme HsdR N-terminal domain-containing protein [Bacteroidales bacterium]